MIQKRTVLKRVKEIQAFVNNKISQKCKPCTRHLEANYCMDRCKVRLNFARTLDFDGAFTILDALYDDIEFGD